MSKKVDSVYFQFPQPTGQFAVGMKSIYLVDHNRTESYAPTKEGFREFMVTAWYPTDSTLLEAIPYAPKYLLDSLKGLFKPFEGVSESDLAELDVIRVPVGADASISTQEKSFPLIVFSHGYHSSRFYYSSLCQELASHGYVVVAIDHTYDAGITELPDGKIIPWARLTDAPDSSDAFYETFKTRLAIRTSDISFVLDCVAKHSDPLFAHVDINKIGIFGHSLGGEAALQAAAKDARIQAVAAMDFFPIGDLIKAEHQVPCMTLAAEHTDWSTFEASQAVHAHLKERAKQVEDQCGYHVLLKGADHVAFSDFSLFSHMNVFKKLPQGSMFSIGSIDGFEAINLIRVYLAAFFDKTLQHVESALLKEGIDDNNHCMVIKRN